jgi:hypothetical protein
MTYLCRRQYEKSIAAMKRVALAAPSFAQMVKMAYLFPLQIMGGRAASTIMAKGNQGLAGEGQGTLSFY